MEITYSEKIKTVGGCLMALESALEAEEIAYVDIEGNVLNSVLFPKLGIVVLRSVLHLQFYTGAAICVHGKVPAGQKSDAVNGMILVKSWIEERSA